MNFKILLVAVLATTWISAARHVRASHQGYYQIPPPGWKFPPVAGFHPTGQPIYNKSESIEEQIPKR
jgi:hypothetical protein